MLAETRTGMRRREGREKAGRGRSANAVPCWATGFASGLGVELGVAVVPLVLRAGGRRAWRLLRCEMLDSLPALAASKWSNACIHGRVRSDDAQERCSGEQDEPHSHQQSQFAGRVDSSHGGSLQSCSLQQSAEQKLQEVVVQLDIWSRGRGKGRLLCETHVNTVRFGEVSGINIPVTRWALDLWGARNAGIPFYRSACEKAQARPRVA